MARKVWMSLVESGYGMVGVLGFDHGQRMPMPITKNVIGAGAIGHHHFIANGIGIGNLPTLIGQQPVDENAGKGFVFIHTPAEMLFFRL